MGKRVSRFDFHRIDAARVSTTSQGFLTVAGRLTRVGVLDYYREDGSVFKELRLPEEVFRTDSLGTLAMAPVTDLHGGMVSPDNVQALGVGIVGPDVAGGDDGPFVTGSATIQRADTIKAVQDRKRTELSPGYQCWVQDEGGTWDGSAYGMGSAIKFDGTQRDIQYNHLAIGPKDWGRSGPDVALRMDGLSKMGAFARCDGNVLRYASMNWRSDAEIAAEMQITPFELGLLLDGFARFDAAMLDKLSGAVGVSTEELSGLLPEDQRPKAESRKQDAAPPAVITRGHVAMKKMIIVVDGMQFEVEVAEALAPTLEGALTKMREDATNLPKVQGELAVANKENGELKVKLDAAADPVAIQAHVNARTQLVQDAAKIAPELKVDAAQDGRAVKIAALTANGFPAATFDDKTDGALIDGMFMAAVHKSDAAPEAPAPGLRVAPGPVPHTDGTDTKAAETPGTAEHTDARRQEMIKRNREASQGRIEGSKTLADFGRN